MCPLRPPVLEALIGAKPAGGDVGRGCRWDKTAAGDSLLRFLVDAFSAAAPAPASAFTADCSGARAAGSPTGISRLAKKTLISMHPFCFSFSITVSVSCTRRASCFLGLPHFTWHFHPDGQSRKKNLDFHPLQLGRVPVNRGRRTAWFGWKW
jgi:hypothetical protein